MIQSMVIALRHRVACLYKYIWLSAARVAIAKPKECVLNDYLVNLN